MTSAKRKIVHVLLALAVLVVGIAGLKALLASKKEMKKTVPPPPIPVVRTMAVKMKAHEVVLLGQGTVAPEKEIQVVPQVAGKIVRVSDALVNGGAFQKGDLLLAIDPADYEIAVTLAEARLKDAESKFQLAEEEAASARWEWRQFNPEGEPPPLVAKEPQLAAARALLAAERANLEKARLDLSRTRIHAPFSGRVAQESADVGQYVSPGQVLANIYSIEAAEISVPMEGKDLFWFHVPGFTPGDGPGAAAIVKGSIAGKAVTMEGVVVRSEGRLDAATRMVKVIVRVENPYDRLPPLANGLFVQVEIQGRRIENAAPIPRAAVRAGGTVWVVNPEGILSFRNIEIARYDTDSALVTGGLVDGEEIVISPIKAVSDGMKVRGAGIEKEMEP